MRIVFAPFIMIEMRDAIMIVIASVLLGLTISCSSAAKRVEPGPSSTVSSAFEQRKSDVQVEDEGVVTRILSDDRQGSPHQRFIITLGSGQTVLVQHNIELAPRVAGIKEGDTVGFFGEYIWNDQGGLIHWTHHDPARKHVGGWIRHKGKTYQ